MAISRIAHLFLCLSPLHKKKGSVCLLWHLSWSIIKYQILFIPIILTNWAPLFLELQSSMKVTDPLTNEKFSVLQIYVKKPKYSWNTETFEKIHIVIIKLAFRLCAFAHMIPALTSNRVWENTEWITACPKTLGFLSMISSYLVRKLRINVYD